MWDHVGAFVAAFALAMKRDGNRCVDAPNDDKQLTFGDLAVVLLKWSAAGCAGVLTVCAFNRLVPL